MGLHAIGERFGDYKLVSPLGEGGFASVYLGEDVYRGTPAAVKLPKEQQVHDFINELRRTILLQHPHIIKIIDFGVRTPDNIAFIIMDYAPNGSFRDKYPRSARVPFDVIVPTVKQVASALQYAHDQRVIHRDVKPENLLLDAHNRVFLSDFGIATSSHSKRVSMGEQASQDVIIGTYAYMSPEQLKGRPVFASDQYSLGIMVYEWFCGEPPFEAREFYQWRYQHQEVPPPSLRASIPSLSPAVEQVVLKALAKRPEERFERIETFALALERAVSGQDVSEFMNPPKGSNRSTHFSSSNNYDNITGPTPANSIEQLFQEGVRAQANGNAEEAFRIWRRIMTMQGGAERYSTAARNRIRELRTQIIPLRLKQVREACMQGLWQNEIALWEDLLVLEPSGEDFTSHLTVPLTIHGSLYSSAHDIQKRLKISQQNEQAAWMYKSAQQFIEKRDYATARTQLQMLWQDAPYYGDPAGLASRIGLPAALNYEQAIVAEQARLKQEQDERERQAREEQEKQEARLKQEREKQEAEKKREEHIALLLKVVGGIIGGITGILAAVLCQTLIGNAAWGPIAGVGELISGGIGGLIGGGIAGMMVGSYASYKNDKYSKKEIPFAGQLIITIAGGIIGGMLLGLPVGLAEAAITGSIAGWVGVILGLVAGLLSGAFIAYFPIVIVIVIVEWLFRLIYRLQNRK